MLTDKALIKAMWTAYMDTDGTELNGFKAALDVARPIIEAPLRAENEKLRAILFQFAAYDDDYENDDSGSMTVITVPIGVIRAAAAALKETGDE